VRPVAPDDPCRGGNAGAMDCAAQRAERRGLGQRRLHGLGITHVSLNEAGKPFRQLVRRAQIDADHLATCRRKSTCDGGPKTGRRAGHHENIPRQLHELPPFAKSLTGPA